MKSFKEGLELPVNPEGEELHILDGHRVGAAGKVLLVFGIEELVAVSRFQFQVFREFKPSQ